MANFGPLAAEIGSEFGAPQQISTVSRLGSVTARHSGSGREPNFAALNRGRHLYSAGRPSRWELAHILVTSKLLLLHIPDSDQTDRIWLNSGHARYTHLTHRLLFC